jgi:hypothetical protein
MDYGLLKVGKKLCIWTIMFCGQKENAETLVIVM